MSSHPYQDLPKSAFWREAVADTSPLALEDVYTKKWPIQKKMQIATAGSCFAQHIARFLRSNGYQVLDVEPAPGGLDPALHNAYGYSMYSARFGNIYTVRQLLQLAREAETGEMVPEVVWEKDGRFFDAHRPNIEPNGLSSADEVRRHRAYHLKKVRSLFEEMNIFVFTLGLTEAWEHIETETVFPTAPGVIGGEFDPDQYRFRNFTVTEIVQDFREFVRVLRRIRGNKVMPRFLLTVSPVPLTATASGKHVLQASTYSKAVLRAAAGMLCDGHERFDYFPSYEIITNQAARGVFFSSNLRSVTSAGVEVVMRVFFAAHPPAKPDAQGDAEAPTEAQPTEEEVQCEEALLEAFGK